MNTRNCKDIASEQSDNGLKRSNMKKQIVVSPDVRKEIIRRTGIKESSLSLALAYQRHGDLSEQARRIALELGGEIVCLAPEIETIHDANGMMIQTLPNGARVVCNKTTGDVQVEYKGEMVATYPNARISTLKVAQELASQLS